MTPRFASLRSAFAIACAAVPAATLMIHASSAWADSESEANAANEAGKVLMYKSEFAGASAKFAIAVSKSNLAKYAVNYCNSLFLEGQFDAALKACKDGQGKNPTAAQASKLEIAIKQIRVEAHKQNKQLFDEVGPDTNPNTGNPNTGDPNNGNPNTGDPNNGNPNTGNPNTGNPNTGNPNTGNPNTGNPNTGNPNTGNPNPNRTPAVGKPPELVKPLGAAEQPYTWSLGAQLIAGGGSIDKTGSVSLGGFRLLGDYLFAPALRIGTQLRLDYMAIVGDQVDSSADITNVGLSIYKHIPFTRMTLTPMIGINGYLLNGVATGDTIQGGGLYAGVAASYSLGLRGEHIFTVGADFNKEFTGTLNSAMTMADIGLSYVTFGIGYTYRFNTPLTGGSGSLFIE
jgi:hypothetical protein